MDLGEFFSFRKMITTGIIRNAYIIGMFVLILLGIAIMTDPRLFEELLYNIDPILAGIIVILLGNLLWRIVCEILILSFSILDNLLHSSLGSSVFSYICHTLKQCCTKP